MVTNCNFTDSFIILVFLRDEYKTLDTNMLAVCAESKIEFIIHKQTQKTPEAKNNMLLIPNLNIKPTVTMKIRLWWAKIDGSSLKQLLKYC